MSNNPSELIAEIQRLAPGNTIHTCLRLADREQVIRWKDEAMAHCFTCQGAENVIGQAVLNCILIEAFGRWRHGQN